MESMKDASFVSVNFLTGVENIMNKRTLLLSVASAVSLSLALCNSASAASVAVPNAAWQDQAHRVMTEAELDAGGIDASVVKGPTLPKAVWQDQAHRVMTEAEIDAATGR